MKSSKIFNFCVCFLAFGIGSCLFKTFFASLFSVLVYAYSIFIYFRSERVGSQPLFIKIGLVLFSYILLSITWSQVGILDSLRFVSEYRSFILIPLVGFALYSSRVQSDLALFFAVGCVIAVVVSYGLGFDLYRITGAELSLANRIFHGLLVSIFTYSLLVAAISSQSVNLKIFLYILATLCAYNIINIETGRTGYILIFALTSLIIFLANKPPKAVLYFFGLIGFGFIALFSFESFGARVSYTLGNVYEILFGDSAAVLNTSAGNRIEFYTKAFYFGLENPFFGVGVGDVELLLASKYQSGEIGVLTDNVHNEYMNMFLIGGFPLVILYVAYLVALFIYGFKFTEQSKGIGWMFMGVAVWLALASLFNSSIKDFWDKQLIILVVGWLISCVLALKDEQDPFKKLKGIMSLTK